MAKIQCKMCGGKLNLPDGILSGECPYCGTLTTFPKVSSGELENLYNRAEHFRMTGEYDKAVTAYEKIVEINPDDAESHWGLLLSKFGIEYVEDPVTHERIPTCHRVQYESISAAPDYLKTIALAGSDEKALYEAEAKRIAGIQRDILAISNTEEPFDIFICYKENDDNGERTQDSVTAQEIYYQLTDAGYKVFFARITLESKLGQQYEPYIFAALNSAKVMLVVGSKKEYFDAVWVRNEWSRFLELMKNDRSKLLIPCYKDMDAYDIPEALSMFQAQDMSKIGSMQDIFHVIEKMFSRRNDGDDDDDDQGELLQRRIQLLIESGSFKKAREYCKKLLDHEPENAWGYYYLLLAKQEISNAASLAQISNLTQLQEFIFARRFADSELADILDQAADSQQNFIQQNQEESADWEKSFLQKLQKKSEKTPRKVHKPLWEHDDTPKVPGIKIPDAQLVVQDAGARSEIASMCTLLDKYIANRFIQQYHPDFILQLQGCWENGSQMLRGSNVLSNENVSYFIETGNQLINQAEMLLREINHQALPSVPVHNYKKAFLALLIIILPVVIVFYVIFQYMESDEPSSSDTSGSGYQVDFSASGGDISSESSSEDTSDSGVSTEASVPSGDSGSDHSGVNSMDAAQPAPAGDRSGRNVM
ncbi:MAG: TIR domain-containing protein [Lentisphaerae bacterium]|nr:TIR domain-containing protein [Lentisphaerota bacterium]